MQCEVALQHSTLPAESDSSLCLYAEWNPVCGGPGHAFLPTLFQRLFVTEVAAPTSPSSLFLRVRLRGRLTSPLVSRRPVAPKSSCAAATGWKMPLMPLFCRFNFGRQEVLAFLERNFSAETQLRHL